MKHALVTLPVHVLKVRMGFDFNVALAGFTTSSNATNAFRFCLVYSMKGCCVRVQSAALG
jgi:hypothetical protein